MNYQIYLKYWDKQDRANSEDPDQMPQNAVSDWGLHYLPLIHQFLDTLSGSKTSLIQFKDKYGKELRGPNIYPSPAEPGYTLPMQTV